MSINIGFDPTAEEAGQAVGPSQESNNTVDIRKLWKDVYYGNGKPGLVTRVALLEGAVSEVKWVGRTLLVIALGILARVLAR